MNLEKAYQNILDESFRKRFPDWDQTSALDPMKTFTESLSCALGEIEKRQVRLTDLLVNSLPAFFGFDRKNCQSQEYYFQIEDAQSLRAVFNVPPQSSFTLTVGNKKLQAFTPKAFEIVPIDNFTSRTDGNSLHLTFSARGGLNELKLFVLASDQNNPNYLERAKLTATLLDGKVQTWQGGDLLIEDLSQAGSENGYLTFRPKPGAPILPQKSADYEIALEFAEPFRARDISFNVVPLSLRQVALQVKLGTLLGQPWEQIPLTEELLVIPDSVRMLLPNQEVVIHRVEMDLLKIRTAEPERFEKSFFYEPFSHSLIFPGAHRLVDHLNSGAALILDKAITSVPLSLSLQESRFDAGDLRVAIEGAKPLVEKGAFIAREGQLEFLKRFYTAVRFFTASQSFTPGILKDELETELTGCHHIIRTVELDVHTHEKRLDVYILTHSATQHNEQHLPDEVVLAVNDRLAQRVPLDYQYRLIPFRRVSLEVQAELSVSLPVQRAGVVSEILLGNKLETCFSRLTAPERMLPGTSFAKNRLGELLKESLSAETSDHTHLLASEISHFELLVRQMDQGLYLDMLHRQAGEFFEVRWGARVSLLAAAVPSSVHRINRRTLNA